VFLLAAKKCSNPPSSLASLKFLVVTITSITFQSIAKYNFDTVDELPLRRTLHHNIDHSFQNY
jgi:hypothetical protein